MKQFYLTVSVIFLILCGIGISFSVESFSNGEISKGIYWIIITIWDFAFAVWDFQNYESEKERNQLQK